MQLMQERDMQLDAKCGRRECRRDEASVARCGVDRMLQCYTPVQRGLNPIYGGGRERREKKGGGEKNEDEGGMGRKEGGGDEVYEG